MSESLATVRPYFELAMKAVDKKFKQHEDAFNIDNIPSSLLDCAWHLGIPNGSMVSFNQSCLSYNLPVTLNVWVKGYRTTLEAVDSGLKKAEAIIKECCRHSKRLNQTFIKNVLPTGFTVSALSGTDDNIARIELTFTILVHIDIET